MHMPPLNLTTFPILCLFPTNPTQYLTQQTLPPSPSIPLARNFFWREEMEIMEDDLFFADLNKQISLLIMDEDDGDVALSPPLHSYPNQDMSYVVGGTQVTQGQGQQQPRNVQEKKNHHEGMSKGTGVFIPKFAQPRRKRTTTFNHHPSRHNLHSHNTNNNYSRPPIYHHYRHQHLDYYTPRRFSQEESKATYFINPE